MKKKIGFLLPYSGEFPALKRALLDPLKAYASTGGADIVTEFINNGQPAKVSSAIEKLFYSDDADLIIGYVGYRVAVELFDKLREYPDKLFLHLSLGEVIPYTHSIINYPPNYCLISYDAWKSSASLGKWVAENLPAGNCMICTSHYDSGYSLQESFRIGYHSNYEKPLEACLLKNPPQSVDTTGLFQEIIRAKPEHLHVILCGRELDDFINRFDEMIDYLPSVSFAFPVSVNSYKTAHPSLQHAYTTLPDKMKLDSLEELADDAFKTLFNYVVSRATFLLDNPYDIQEPDTISILEMNINKNKITKTDFSESLPAALNVAFNHSAENAVTIWQNPYLCI